MPKFRGTFNAFGEIHELYTQARDMERAKINLIVQLSHKIGRSYCLTKCKYGGSKDNFKIEEV